MSSKKKEKNVASWRSIRQGDENLREEGKRRRNWVPFRWLMYAGVFVVVVIVAGFLAYRGSFGDVELLPAQVAEVVYYTDGKLPEDRVLEGLALDGEFSLMDVDIFSIKEQLEGISQVKEATVVRDFPGKLRITVEEHQAAFRVIAEDKSGKRMGLLVSDMGEVFRGKGYTREVLGGLPFLKGARIKRVGGGFGRLEGVEYAAQIHELLKGEMADFAAGVRSYEVRGGAGGGLGEEHMFVEVVSGDGLHVTFGSRDLEAQMGKLGSVLEYSRGAHMAKVKKIDLSLGNQVAVKVEGA